MPKKIKSMNESQLFNIALFLVVAVAIGIFTNQSNAKSISLDQHPIDALASNSKRMF